MLWGALDHKRQVNPSYKGPQPGPDISNEFLSLHPDYLLPDGSVTPQAGGMDPKLAAILAGLAGKQGPQGPINLGPAGLPGQISAPTMRAPDYSAADAAFAQAKPHPIMAPQYVKPNYAAADEMYAKATPEGRYTDEAYQDDKWGRIIQGFSQALLGSDDHRLLAGLIGGLGGYGSALSNKSKMDTETADKMAGYYLQRGNFEGEKTRDINNVENQQQNSNFQAARGNESANETYFNALGRYEGEKAGTGAEVANRNAVLQMQAAIHNAGNAAYRQPKFLGMNKNNMVVQTVDDKGNIIVKAVPMGSVAGVLGNSQGDMFNDPTMAGLETLVDGMISTGQIRGLLGDQVYTALSKPYADYAPAGPLGAIGTLGDQGKKTAFGNAQAEFKNNVARYLMQNPDMMKRMIDQMVVGK